MSELLAFAAGVVVALIARRLRAGGGAQAATASRPDDPAAALLSINAELTAIGETSSHPRDLASQPRFREAVQMLVSSSVPFRTVLDHAVGANWMLAAVGCAALCEREDREAARDTMARHLRFLGPWPLYYALQYFAGIEDRPPMGALVLHGPPYWSEHPLTPGLFKEHFAARAERGDEPSFGNALADTTPDVLEAAETLLKKIDHPAAEALLAELGTWRQRRLDRDFLQSIGRILNTESETQLLMEHEGLKEPLAALEASMLDEPFRSALVVGDPRSGKTSFILLLAARAAARGWTVLEAGAANLMVGQMYFGQLEERLSRLTTELAVDKRVIWYIPDFTHLAVSGTHPGQAASLLDQVLPAITAGRIAVISETTPAALSSVLQRRPALRSAVDLIRLPPLSDQEIDALVQDVSTRVAALCNLEISSAVTNEALHLTRHYLGTGQMPGAALDLVKLTAQRVAAHDGSRVERDDVLATLSQVTGMPKLVLDARARLELASIRRFFAERVIGQEEAVEAVVDRIAMLKAGLTDPARPTGVFLFAGPTGTGKTELAKTLAEFLFGSADRLIRLDMSEFQAVESTRKILGEPGVADGGQALTDRVRKQPFSVILLDEFEKAHPNAWDLFLQVFDDGRLTDAAGDTVDFRHTIIILTSNLGSTIRQDAGPGFAPVTGGFSPEHVVRAIHQNFRPEFVNRLDAIIVFRPLTRTLMRGILSKELGRVLERRGLRQREWAVEWESSALDFLLEKGFSPAMGARPLKRAIDRYLLAPLAATLVEHRFPEGDQFLFVRSDGRGIQVEFVDPDAPAEPAAPIDVPAQPEPGVTLARMMLYARGTSEESSALALELAAVEQQLTGDAWTSIEQDLVTAMQQPDFWNCAKRFDVLARYALMDRVRTAAETARRLHTRLARSAGGDGRTSRDLVARLATQLYVLRHGLEDVVASAPVEVVVTVQPALDGAQDSVAATRWCERLLDMYRRWASRRHMQIEELTAEPATPLVVISGFGAARILSREAGLHVLEYDSGEDGPSRAVARVRVAPTPVVLPDDTAGKNRAFLVELDRTPAQTTVVRRYRLDGSPLVRDGQAGWRTGRQDLVLDGNFDILGDVLGIEN